MSLPSQPNIKPGIQGSTFLWDQKDLFDMKLIGFTGVVEDTGQILVRYLLENWTPFGALISGLNASYRIEAEEDINRKLKPAVEALLYNNGNRFVRLYLEWVVNDNQELEKIINIRAKHIE